MGKKILLITVCLLMIYSLTGCTFSEVVKDIISVNNADLTKKDGPKVEIKDPVMLEEDSQEETPDNTLQPEEETEPTPEETAEPANLVYCLSPVNVREGGGNAYPVIGALTAGEAVEKLGQEGNWIKISYKGSEGWVYGKYLSEGN